MNIKIIKCPYCQNTAADHSGKIICGNTVCEAYPPIMKDENASLEEKIRALLASGPKTIDLMADHLEEHRKVVSGVLYQLKSNQEVSSEYDSKLEAFVWRAIGAKSAELLTFEQKSALVLEALSAGKNLPRAIARFTKLTEAETIITLTAMESEEDIVRRNEANFSAWFLKSNVPKGKLILDGNGGVMEIEVAKPAISEEVRKKAEEELEKQNQKVRQTIQEKQLSEEKQNMEKKEDMAIIETPVNAINAEIETTKNNLITDQSNFPEKTREKEKASTLQKGIVYTEEMFEDFGKRKIAKRQIAKELGISVGTLSYHLNKPNLQAAFNRGLDPSKKDSAVVRTKQKRTSVVWTEELLEGLAERHFEVALAANEIGVHYTALNKQLKNNSSFLRAWYRGLEKYLKKYPGHKIDHRSWYYKAQELFKETNAEVPKTAEILKTFVSKCNHIEVVLDGDKQLCHLKCKFCNMNRSFNLFQDAAFDNERITIALTEFEEDHEKCHLKVQTFEPIIEPVIINNRIGEVMERLHPPKQVGVSSAVGKAIQIPNYPEFSNDVAELQPVVNNPNQKTLSFSCGGNLNLNLEDFNFFDADEETRVFLNNIINQIQEFEEAKAEKISRV